jgi:hypothetical protein
MPGARRAKTLGQMWRVSSDTEKALSDADRAECRTTASTPMAPAKRALSPESSGTGMRRCSRSLGTSDKRFDGMQAIL